MEHLKNLGAGLALIGATLFVAALFRQVELTHPKALLAAAAIAIFFVCAYVGGKLVRGLMSK